MIKISNLHKSFNGVEVLKGINLDIKKGEVLPARKNINEKEEANA